MHISMRDRQLHMRESFPGKKISKAKSCLTWLPNKEARRVGTDWVRGKWESERGGT